MSNRQQLTEAERYKIEGYLEECISILKIAQLLNRNRRTVEREITSGEVKQKRLNLSNSKSIEQRLYLTEYLYKADYAQMRANCKNN